MNKSLISGKKSQGGYYVRPLDWEGIWDGEGNLVSGRNLFESQNEDECKIFAQEYLEIDKGEYGNILGTTTDNTEFKRLVSENPDLPIMFLCGEGCYNDDYGYTANKGSFCIEEVTQIGDYIYDDKDDLLDKIYSDFSGKFPEANENLIEALAQEQFSRYIWKKVITVTLG